MASAPPPLWQDRLVEIEHFIEASKRWADEAEHAAQMERVFATPGDWDYDWAIDQLAVVEAVRQSIVGLEREKQAILDRRGWSRG